MDETIHHFFGFNNLWFEGGVIGIGHKPKPIRKIKLIAHFSKRPKRDVQKSQIIRLSVTGATFHNI